MSALAITLNPWEFVIIVFSYGLCLMDKLLLMHLQIPTMAFVRPVLQILQLLALLVGPDVQNYVVPRRYLEVRCCIGS